MVNLRAQYQRVFVTFLVPSLRFMEFKLFDVNCIYYTALLWQNEASDIPAKFEFLMLAKFHAQTLILLRVMLDKTS